jgi:hypothetical protein
MNIEGLIISIGLLLLGLILGYLWGEQRERSRIYEAFRYEEYTYDEFYNVLEHYEKIRR